MTGKPKLDPNSAEAGKAKLNYDPEKTTAAGVNEHVKPDVTAQLFAPLGGYPVRSKTSLEDLSEPPVPPGKAT